MKARIGKTRDQASSKVVSVKESQPLCGSFERMMISQGNLVPQGMIQDN